MNLLPFAVVFFLAVDVLRFQHAPKPLLFALIIADFAALGWGDMWEIQATWKTLRILSFLDLVWECVKWFGQYMQNW
jgi:hypothetical protein